MSAGTHFYEPAAGHRLKHDPFKAIIAPRPIGWVSTVSEEGIVNLAPYSFFNAFCDRPPIIAFSSGGRKDSLRNAEATGEFTWSMATRALSEAMNTTSALVPPDIDEFALAGLKPAPGQIVRPPRVAESPAAMECKVTQIVELHGLDGASARHWLVIGQVVGVHIAEAFLRDGLFDTAAANPIMRAGYLADYAEISSASMFRMQRPS